MVDGKTYSCIECISGRRRLWRQKFILTDEQKKNNKIIRRKKYFDKFVESVHNKGGVCLGTSDDYKTNRSNIRVKCADGHEWCTSWSCLDSGTWCPVCKTNLGELVSFNSCEYLFDTKFKKIRPHWLLSSNKTRLELDMYNKQLNLAIEYNGLQHYKYIPFFHRTHKEFLKRLDYDKQKIKLCKEQNVNLIVVPYTVKASDICQYISYEANKLGILTANNHKEFDLSKVRCISSKKNKIEPIIESKKGVLIECIFFSSDCNVTIKCEYGHVWTTKNKYIMKGSWCHVCAYRRDKQETIQTEHDKQETTKREHDKRSITMKIQKEKFRLNLTSIKCGGACGEIKPLDAFYKRATAKSGYQSWCKKCTNDYKRKWRSQLRNDKEAHNCPYCDKKYKLKDRVTRHIKENH